MQTHVKCRWLPTQLCPLVSILCLCKHLSPYVQFCLNFSYYGFSSENIEIYDCMDTCALPHGIH